MLLQAYLNKAIDYFVAEGIEPHEVDVDRLVRRIVMMINDMVSVEDAKGNIHFFGPRDFDELEDYAMGVEE